MKVELTLGRAGDIARFAEFMEANGLVLGLHEPEHWVGDTVASCGVTVEVPGAEFLMDDGSWSCLNVGGGDIHDAIMEFMTMIEGRTMRLPGGGFIVVPALYPGDGE